MLKYERTLTDGEVAILNHDLLDIKDWIDKMIDGKIYACLKRGANLHRDNLKASGADMVPVNDGIAFKQMIASKDYKNRVERDAIELERRSKAVPTKQ